MSEIADAIRFFSPLFGLLANAMYTKEKERERERERKRERECYMYIYFIYIYIYVYRDIYAVPK